MNIVDLVKKIRVNIQQSIPGKIFNLVFVRGYVRKSLMILTNLDIKNGKDCLRPILCYIFRWNVEEFIMAMAYISLTSKSISNRNMIFILQEISKRVHSIPPFPYYSTGDGIYEVLKKYKSGITEFFNYTKNKPKSQQLSIFELSHCNDLLVS